MPESVNPTIKFSSLKIDGTEYKLVYDFDAIAKIERESECSLLDGLVNLGSLSLLQLRGFLFGAMRPLQPDTKLSQVSKLIRPDTVREVLKRLAEAYRYSVERKPDPRQAEAPPAEN